MRMIRHNEIYKRVVVQYKKMSGKSIAEIGRELNINANTLYGWVKKYDEHKAAVVQECRYDTCWFEELQKKNRELREENKVLKRAIHLIAID